MTDLPVEEHSSLIKTPQQLVVVVLLSFIVPLATILLVVQLITGGLRVDPDSGAMTEEAIAERMKPVGELTVVAASDTSSAGTKAGGGEQVYNTVCQACHAIGLAGAPKVGDKGAWETRLAQGVETLYTSAIKGKNTMPPKGGALGTSDDDIKAAVDIMIAKSK